MNFLNTTLNAVVAGTIAFVVIALIGENVTAVDAKFLKPEVFGVFALGTVFVAAATREIFFIHDNLH